MLIREERNTCDVSRHAYRGRKDTCDISKPAYHGRKRCLRARKNQLPAKQKCYCGNPKYFRWQQKSLMRKRVFFARKRFFGTRNRCFFRCQRSFLDGKGVCFCCWRRRFAAIGDGARQERAVACAGMSWPCKSHSICPTTSRQSSRVAGRICRARHSKRWPSRPIARAR